MVSETYKKIKTDFGFIFFVIVTTNLSVSLIQTGQQKAITWTDYATLTIQNSVAVLIAMAIMLYLFKGFSKKDWSFFSW